MIMANISYLSSQIKNNKWLVVLFAEKFQQVYERQSQEKNTFGLYLSNNIDSEEMHLMQLITDGCYSVLTCYDCLKIVNFLYIVPILY